MGNQMRGVNRKQVLITAALILFSGLVSAAELSGFLINYPKLAKDPDVAGANVWMSSPTALQAYDRVRLEPVEIWIHPDSAYKGIEPDEMKLLTDSFMNVLAEKLEPEYPLVMKSGQNVLGVRIAITNINLQKKKRNLFGYTPIGFAATTAMEAAGKRVSLKDAIVEAELYDTSNDKRLVVVVLDSKIVSDQYSNEKELSWENVEQSLEIFATNLIANIKK